MMNHGHIDGDKMHLWRWRLTTKKAFSQNALNEIFCCQWHAVGSLWNHISSICQEWLEHWIQSSSCYKTFSRISFSYHIGFSTLIKHSVEKSVSSNIANWSYFRLVARKGRLIGKLFSSQPKTPYWTLSPYIWQTHKKRVFDEEKVIENSQ